MTTASVFPIMVKVWAGKSRHDFRYIRRSLPSLLNSDLPPEAVVVLINDRSLDTRVQPFLEQCQASDSRVRIWLNEEQLGPNRGQAVSFQRLAKEFPDAPHYVICDDDIIYHPGWLQRLIMVRHEAEEAGLRGVFTALNVPFRPAFDAKTLPTSEVLIKERQAALNWLIPRNIYEEVGPFQDKGIAYDSEYCNRMAALNLPVICMKPSYVQNIGYLGAYQFDDTYTAPDYVGHRDFYLRGRDVWYRTRRTCLSAARSVKHALLGSQ